MRLNAVGWSADGRTHSNSGKYRPSICAQRSQLTAQGLGEAQVLFVVANLLVDPHPPRGGLTHSTRVTRLIQFPFTSVSSNTARHTMQSAPPLALLREFIPSRRRDVIALLRQEAGLWAFHDGIFAALIRVRTTVAAPWRSLAAPRRSTIAERR